MLIFYYCGKCSYQSLWKFTHCKLCGSPVGGEIQCLPKGEGTKMLEGLPVLQPVPPPGEVRSHPWRMTKHDWAVLKALWIDPEEPRPTYGRNA